MAVVLAEVLNQLLEGYPQVARALLLAYPQVRKFNIGTPGAVATVSTLAYSVTVNGVNVGDFVWVSKPTAQTGLGVVGARVTAANTIEIIYVNPTAGPLTPTASETYLCLHAPGLASQIVGQIP
jgi:hypothetical protein